MRNLIFKNRTSNDRRRKIISSAEIIDSSGVNTLIKRQSICMIKEINSTDSDKFIFSPNIYVLKERNTKLQLEKFFCRIKGSICTEINKKQYLILFMHTLKIIVKNNLNIVNHV